MLLKVVILFQAGLLLLGVWHVKAAFLIQAGLLLLMISPVWRTITYLSEVDLRLTYLERELDCMWWWKRNPKLREAIEAVLLDELEGRTTAGASRGSAAAAEQEEEGDEP